MFQKLREKQPGESIKEKDLKAAIKENIFNEDVESKREKEVFKEWIRKGVHKNDVKAEDKGSQLNLEILKAEENSPPIKQMSEKRY